MMNTNKRRKPTYIANHEARACRRGEREEEEEEEEEGCTLITANTKTPRATTAKNHTDVAASTKHTITPTVFS